MKFLVFQHVPHEHPGMLTDAAKERGVELQVVELWKPYEIPASADMDGLVIMGGPMGVYEDQGVYPSKDDEMAFIRKNMHMPMIGFCLGSQLLAHTLGAEVYPNEKDGKKIKEIGYYDVELTSEGKADPLFEGFHSPVNVLQWHGDAFDLPKDAVLLATSPACTNQAFRYGKNIYGMLFHNEFTPAMIADQILIDRAWIHKDFDMNEEKLRLEARTKETLMRNQCKTLFSNFCKIVSDS